MDVKEVKVAITREPINKVRIEGIEIKPKHIEVKISSGLMVAGIDEEGQATSNYKSMQQEIKDIPYKDMGGAVETFVSAVESVVYKDSLEVK